MDSPILCLFKAARTSLALLTSLPSTLTMRSPLRRPVLSPIYGNMKESEKEPKDVHDAIHLPKAKTKNPLNTVLSPMYGEYELETFEKEAKATISKRREKELQIESAFVANDAAEAEEEEVLTLDEMLSVDEEEDANEPRASTNRNTNWGGR